MKNSMLSSLNVDCKWFVEILHFCFKIGFAGLKYIIFIAFHANPIGGHLNAYRTYHQMCQRYFWPGMFTYVKRMCKACPGCSLSNLTKNRSADLVYSFPNGAPMRAIFVDIYETSRIFYWYFCFCFNGCTI